MAFMETNGSAPRHRIRKHAQKFKSHLNFERHWADKVADILTQQFGTLWFLVWNAVFFIGWIEWNLGLYGVEPFDPFPFGFLTMFVSLEAIFLAIVVLISQNRQNKVADMRQQIDFEIDVRAEAEVTKLLRMQHLLFDHLKISKDDPDLKEMESALDLIDIQREIENDNS